MVKSCGRVSVGGRDGTRVDGLRHKERKEEARSEMAGWEVAYNRKKTELAHSHRSRRTKLGESAVERATVHESISPQGHIVQHGTGSWVAFL